MFEKYAHKYTHTHFFFSAYRSTTLKYLFTEFEQYNLKKLKELLPSIFDEQKQPPDVFYRNRCSSQNSQENTCVRVSF